MDGKIFLAAKHTHKNIFRKKIIFGNLSGLSLFGDQAIDLRKIQWKKS